MSDVVDEVRGEMAAQRNGWHLTQGIAFIAKWLAISLPLGVLVGSAVALFLWLLDQVIQTHWHHPWILFLLPLAGLVSGLIYHRWGRTIEAGNQLVLEEIQKPAGVIPARLAPLVLLGTLITHLGGGSAGREGTAVQMGGSLASLLGGWLRLNPEEVRLLLQAGVAAGFGAVFGTPLTGTIFAWEICSRASLPIATLIPSLLASVLADQVTLAWGIEHTSYPLTGEGWASVPNGSLPPHLSLFLLAKIAVAAALFGVVSALFVRTTHTIQQFLKRHIERAWLRPLMGGCVIIFLTLLLGDRDYLGLGVDPNPAQPSAVTIPSSFHADGARSFSWLWKIIFTSITVGSGFKGGEATPLFFIGATSGHLLGELLGVPVELLAALGFVAVFASATKTPLACTIMALELFGRSSPSILATGFPIHAALACFIAYRCSGKNSIYSATSKPATR